MKKYRYLIGIDPGVNTGIAGYDTKEKIFEMVESGGMYKTLHFVLHFPNLSNLFVRLEDARKRTWIPQERDIKQRVGRAKGAGSVSRDCQIWEEFLTFHGIAFELVAPKNNKTKLDAKTFANYTGWKGKTNEHSRDAGMLVFQFANAIGSLK